MVVGVGVDVVEIARIKAAMASPRFLPRILTRREIEFMTTPERVAGRWAAKEAVAKAVGLHLGWQDVEILNDELGQPRVTISHPSFDPGRLRVLVSISHSRENAVAMAVVERLIYQAPSV